jgi:hypothetical protein
LKPCASPVPHLKLFKRLKYRNHYQTHKPTSSIDPLPGKNFPLSCLCNEIYIILESS